MYYDAGIPTDLPSNVSLDEYQADIDDEKDQFDELDWIMPFDYFS